MGKLLDRLLGTAVVDAPGILATADSTYVLPTFQGGDVSQVANLPQSVAQAFGINLDSDRVTRDQAMTIPAVRQGRNVIAGKIGTAPFYVLRQTASGAERIDRPAFFNQPDPNTTLASLLTWTVDDLLFYPLAWWRVLARDAFGFPARAERLDPRRVRLDYALQAVYVDGVPADPANLIAFQSPDEGILKHGGRTLRTAIMLEEAARKYARMDIPLGYFTDDQGGSLLDDEIQVFLNQWESYRSTRTTGYIPKGLSYNQASLDPKAMQLVEARAFQSAEVARLMNLKPSAVNAPTNDSLTYGTTEADRRELVDLTFAPYVTAIQQRLGMPDVVRPTDTPLLDFQTFIRGSLAETIATGAAAVAAGLMTRDEVRVDWLKLAPLGDQGTDAASAVDATEQPKEIQR